MVNCQILSWLNWRWSIKSWIFHCWSWPMPLCFHRSRCTSGVAVIGAIASSIGPNDLAAWSSGGLVQQGKGAHLRYPLFWAGWESYQLFAGNLIWASSANHWKGTSGFSTTAVLRDVQGVLCMSSFVHPLGNGYEEGHIYDGFQDKHDFKES